MLLKRLLLESTYTLIAQRYFFSSKTAAAPAVDVAANDPYKSSSFIGHSLWMVPSSGSKARNAYFDLVADISNDSGTFQFVPHITLVAAVMTPVNDVVRRTHLLAAQLAPYRFELDSIASRDAYFQCVYAKMKSTPEVWHANHVARQVFPERQSDPPYVPHLSLVYGDFSQDEKDQRIIPKLQGIMMNIDNNNSNNNNSQTTANDFLVIPVDAIEVWSTQGDVKEWYLVEIIPLSGGGDEMDSETSFLNNTV